MLELNLYPNKPAKIVENLVVDSDFKICDSDNVKFHDYLTVNGDFFLDNMNISQLPEHLTVYGDLKLTSVHIKKMPTYLTVNGDIYLINSIIDEEFEELIAKSIDYNNTIINGVHMTSFTEYF